MKKRTILVISIIPILLLVLWTIRLVSPVEIDDVTPGITCQVDLLEKSDILWIIPIFNNQSITNNTEWCEYIKSLNKEVQLHGVYHTYNEFSYPRDSDYLQQGIYAFQSCFQQTPSKFKPPQLAYTTENNNIIEQENLKRFGKINQLFHKVYHCNDTGIFSNNFINWF